jgi:hypothetical protein
MRMMIFLTTQPLWLSGAILVGLVTLAAMAGPVVVRRHVSLSRLSTNNEVAGFKFATVGVLYAVLLGFAVIVVWEKFSDAEHEVAQEAGASATIYRLSNGISTPASVEIHDALSFYLRTAIAKDWPAMEHGHASAEATHALNNLYTTTLRFRPADPRETVLLTEILHQLDIVGEARRDRLVMASGIVPGIVWLVLFGGATLTIGFTFFFGTENLRAQTIMTGMLSVLILSALLTIVAIDHPFAGTVKVGPEAISGVLEDFG